MLNTNDHYSFSIFFCNFYCTFSENLSYKRRYQILIIIKLRLVCGNCRFTFRNNYYIFLKSPTKLQLEPNHCSIFVYICPFVCLAVNLSACPSFLLFVCLSVFLCLCLCLFSNHRHDTQNNDTQQNGRVL